LGIAIHSSSPHWWRGTASGTPVARMKNHSTATPPLNTSVRNSIGGSSATPTFITGQFRPQATVSAASRIKSRRERRFKVASYRLR
jgi:hypothetical protein